MGKGCVGVGGWCVFGCGGVGLGSGLERRLGVELCVELAWGERLGRGELPEQPARRAVGSRHLVVLHARKQRSGLLFGLLPVSIEHRDRVLLGEQALLGPLELLLQLFQIAALLVEGSLQVEILALQHSGVHGRVRRRGLRRNDSRGCGRPVPQGLGVSGAYRLLRVCSAVRSARVGMA